MYKLIVGATFAALFAGASAAEAQVAIAARDVPPGQRPPAGMCRIWIDGVPPGRQPPVMDCATARARAPHNARIIYGDNTPFPGRGNANRGSRDCRYEQDRRPSLGEIIFGRRSGESDCRWDTRQANGSWYEVGRDVYGNRVYQRTVRTRDGSVVLQRGRVERGRMVVVETRYPDSRTVRGGLTDEEVWARSSRRGNARWDNDDDDRRRVQQARGNNNNRKQAQRGRGNGRGNGRGR